MVIKGHPIIQNFSISNNNLLTGEIKLQKPIILLFCVLRRRRPSSRTRISNPLRSALFIPWSGPSTALLFVRWEISWPNMQSYLKIVRLSFNL
jgi:hypothetical protein